MSPRLSDPPVAIVHRSLRVYSDASCGLVICPTSDSRHDSSSETVRSAVRLHWGTKVPEEIEWRAPVDQPGLDVHCLGGVLVGFEGKQVLVPAAQVGRIH